MAPHTDCPCMRRTGSSSNCSSASSSSVSSSSSSSRRLSSSAGSLRVFPSTEPEDYCRPTLSVNTKLNESQRLAVLLDQSLWKRDSDSDECDSLGCATRFTLFERKHHCRKCGGIFCQTCSGKTLPLLDTSRMPFVIPPSNVPLPLLAVSSPTGALVPSRVCDDCHALLTGAVPPSIHRVRAASASALPACSTASPRLGATTPSLETVPALSHSPSGSSSAASYAHSAHSGSAMYYPCGTTFVVKPRHLRRSRTTSSSTSRSTSGIARRDSLNTARSSSPSVAAQHRASPIPQTPTPLSPAASTASTDFASLGVLAEYPLKVPSKGCKQTGGAFWVPKPLPRRLDSPIRYEAPSPRRHVDIAVREEDEDAVDEDDEGAPPVVPIRRTITRSCFEVAVEKAPFACPTYLRDKDCISTF
ncbi:hypothetical protein M407DRAFT_185926 [Tulasnella calospora MUT 4182]|uniref:FYVE-type domain-containing protein n=1 Tax=Tulasnella calospora MUT 4182 TaxID=1051891 RepID=A0A0C3QVE5_9AGAM|nr:hypothetical protein M407DRAFT_185926 [Tulasnella calospora MUT 4182]